MRGNNVNKSLGASKPSRHSLLHVQTYFPVLPECLKSKQTRWDLQSPTVSYDTISYVLWVCPSYLDETLCILISCSNHLKQALFCTRSLPTRINQAQYSRDWGSDDNIFHYIMFFGRHFGSKHFPFHNRILR